MDVHPGGASVCGHGFCQLPWHAGGEVFDRLAAHNIIARKYFYPITNSFDCYRGRPGFDPELTPVANYVGDRVLTLPLYADLAAEDVDRICDIILSM